MNGRSAIPWPPRLFLITSLAILGFALVFWLAPKELTPQPPSHLPEVPRYTSHTPQTSSTVEIGGPWVAVLRERDRAPTPAPPAPEPEAKAAAPDRESLRYLGALTQDANRFFLFKFLPNGQALVLSEGEDRGGWTLVAAEEHVFVIIGPGGRYEVSRP